jgi:hypothetical protein
MDNETEKIIKEQMKILPEEIRNLFTDPKINEQISRIGETYKFDTEKMGALQMETALLMLGLTNPNEYPNELKNRLKTDDETLNNIVKEISAFISGGIMEKLKEVYKKTEDENRGEKNKFMENAKGGIALLPKEKQELINNFGWEKIAEEIGKNHNLSEDEISVLKKEVTLILIDFRDFSFLAINIEDYAGINKNEAEKIAEEINQKIFKPMMNKLNENIKKTLKDRNIHWQQNLDFILSGGDYTAFIRRVENEMKDELPKNNDTFNPSKLDDLKSKFTI